MRNNNYYFEVEDLHLIKMERNSYSGIATKECDIKRDREEIYSIKQFYLFDYFDRLAYVRKYKKDSDNESNLSYAECFGTNKLVIDEHTPPALARLLFSLVRYSHTYKSDKNINPFECCDRGEDLPFLALMFVTISVDNRQEKQENQIKHGDFSFLGKMISACISELRYVIHRIIKERYGYSKKPETPVFSVFQTVNTNDLCIVLRTRNVVDAYEITHNITQLHNFKKNNDMRVPCNKELKGIVYSTFTTVGIAHDCDSETLLRLHIDSQKERNNTDKTNVVLRFQICNDVEKEKILKNYTSLGVSDGLYGRYNFTLTLTMEEFYLLYPILSAYKFGEYISFDDWSKSTQNLHCVFSNQIQNSECRLDLIKRIAKDIAYNFISVVNERIVPDIETIVPGARSNISENSVEIQHSDCIFDKKNRFINEQKKRLKVLAAKESKLEIHRYAYKEAIRQLYELFRTYANLWYQNDTEINGNLFLIQINVIINNVELQIDEIIKMANNVDSIESKNKLHMLLKNVILSIRKSVTAMNNFHKLVQSVNQQTIQAPNYEIQTEVDIEKFIVAYSEFLRSICREHTNYCKTNVIFPIFTIDISTDMLNAEMLFDDFHLDDVLTSNETAKIYSIKTPNIESFARMYDTIPQLCHEVSHGLQLCDNIYQNKALIYILSHDVSTLICERLFYENRISYDNNDKLFLLCKKSVYLVIKDVFYEFIQKNNYLKNIVNKPILTFKNEFVKFLTSELFSNSGSSELGATIEPYKGVEKYQIILESLQNLYNYSKSYSVTECEEVNKRITALQACCESIIVQLYDILNNTNNSGEPSTHLDVNYIINNAWDIYVLAINSVSQRRISKISQAIDSYCFELNETSDEIKAKLNLLSKIIRKINSANSEKKHLDFFRLAEEIELMLTGAKLVKYHEENVSNDIQVVKSYYSIEVLNEFNQFLCEIGELQFNLRTINEMCEHLPVDLLQFSFDGMIKKEVVKKIAKNIGENLSIVFEENKFEAARLTNFQKNNHKNILLNCSKTEREEIIDKTFSNISFSQIDSLSEYVMSFYRETTADLGMCALCGFNVFGYIKFFTDQLSIDESYRNLFQPDSASANRVKYVISVLMQHELQNGGKLIKNSIVDMEIIINKVKSYINNLHELITRRVMKTTKERLHYVNKNIDVNTYFTDVLDVINKFCKQYIDALDYIYQNKSLVCKEKPLVTLGDIFDSYKKCLNAALKKRKNKNQIAAQLCEIYTGESDFDLLVETFAGEMIKHIARMISRVECVYELVEGICPDGSMVIDEELHNLFNYVYISNAPNITHEPYALWERQPGKSTNGSYNHVRKSIRDYYNDADCQGDLFVQYMERFSEHNMYLKSISFALMYYYKNRYYFSCDASNMQNEYMNFFRIKGVTNE